MWRIDFTGALLASAVLACAHGADCDYDATLVYPPDDCGSWFQRYIFAQDLNNLGQFVGQYTQCGGGPPDVGYVWTPEQGMWPIPLPEGGIEIVPSRINNAGLVTGSIDFGNDGWRFFVYDIHDGSLILPDVLPTGWHSAWALNEHGEIAGAWGVPDTEDEAAFRWNGKGDATLLDVGSGDETIRDLNEHGIGVGMTAYWPIHERRAAIYDGERTRVLATPAGFAGTSLWGVNNTGLACGSLHTESNGSIAAARTNESWVELGHLNHPDATWSSAGSVNDAGEIVGQVFLSDGTSRAFRWHDGRQESIIDFVPPGLPVWLVTRATAVNSNGAILALVATTDPTHLSAVLLLAPTSRPRSDVTGDCVVDADDLSLLLAQWGVANVHADVNGDGEVEFGDVLALLAEWTIEGR